jgi:apolipoprotein N-acyltransferase
VTNTGLTGFVAPNGRIQKQAPLFVTTTLTDTILPMGGVTPYTQLGDNFILVALLLLLLLILLLSYVLGYKSKRKDQLSGSLNKPA